MATLSVPDGSAPLADRIRQLRRRRRAMTQRLVAAIATGTGLLVVVLLAIGMFGH